MHSPEKGKIIIIIIISTSKEKGLHWPLNGYVGKRVFGGSILRVDGFRQDVSVKQSQKELIILPQGTTSPVFKALPQDQVFYDALTSKVTDK